MRLLVDSHAVIWWVDQDHLLGPNAHAAITDPGNGLLLSAATIWEIAIKVGLGKLSLSLPYHQWMTRAIDDLGLSVLPIHCGIRRRAGAIARSTWRPFRPAADRPGERGAD